MRCPECDREMSRKDSGKDRARNGKVYDWAKYTCGYDDTWTEVWTTPKEE